MKAAGGCGCSFCKKRMTLRQADLLEGWLQAQAGVQQATVHERTCCAIVRYTGERARILARFSGVLLGTGRGGDRDSAAEQPGDQPRL